MCITNPLVNWLDHKNNWEDKKPYYIAILMSINPIGGYLGSYLVKYLVIYPQLTHSDGTWKVHNSLNSESSYLIRLISSNLLT